MSADLTRDALRARVEVLAATGRSAEAATLLEEQAPVHLDESWLYTDLAQQYLRLDRPGDAERAARQALALEPGGRDALLLLALALKGSERFADAQEAAAEAVALYPDDDVAHRIAAAILIVSGTEEEAAEGWRHIRHALKLNPHDPDHYVVAVYANLAVGGPVSLGRRYLEDGLALDPGHRGLILAGAALGDAPTGPDRAELFASLLAVNPLDDDAHRSLRSEFFQRLISLAFIPWLQVLFFGLLASSLGGGGVSPTVALVLLALLLAVGFVQRLRQARRLAPGQAGSLVQGNLRVAGGAAAGLAGLGILAVLPHVVEPGPQVSAAAALGLSVVLFLVAAVRAATHLRRFPPGYARDLFGRNRRAWAGVGTALAAFALATAGTLWTAADGGAGPGLFLLMATAVPSAAAVHLLEGAERGSVPRRGSPGFADYRKWRVGIYARPVWYLLGGAVLALLPMLTQLRDLSPLEGAAAVTAGVLLLARGLHTLFLLLASAPAPDARRGVRERLAVRAGRRVLISGDSFINFALVCPLVMVVIGAVVLMGGTGGGDWLDGLGRLPAPDFLPGGSEPPVPDITPVPVPEPTLLLPQDLPTGRG